MRHMDHLTLTDRWIVIYLSLVSLQVLIGWSSLSAPRLHIAVNLILILGIWVLSAYHATHVSSTFWRIIHQFYPIPLLIWWYPQSTVLRHVFIPVDMDPWLLKAELFLFGKEWYLILPQVLPLWITEFFHSVYFFYYLGLLLFPALAFKRQSKLVTEYVFVLMGVMLSLQIVIMVFPSSGPVFHREEVFPQRLVFVSLMDWVYRTFDRGGGAFPSIHSAAAVVMAAYGQRFFPRKSWFFYALLAAILIATVACSYHYVLDTVVGAILGFIMIRPLRSFYQHHRSHHAD